MTWISPLKELLFGPGREVRELIPEIEEKLLSADVGVATTQMLVDALQTASPKTGQEAYGFLKGKVEEILTSTEKIPPNPPLKKGGEGGFPKVIFFVGINGVGKTTTIGKLAHRLKSEGKKVMLVAADTFRAAARDQLGIWAERSQAEFVGGSDNADPASVVFDGCSAAKARKCDVALIDTAGRLQTKTHLMEELKKMVRAASKAAGRLPAVGRLPGAGRPPDEILLILDATTGQNGLNQARVFLDAVPLTGLVLTKYDGTAKGGILVSIVRETGLPLRYVGVGEKIEDLKPFSAHEFVSSLFA
ncbi:MAG: signal recognition particle-docking protein FtsY [Deltaproteobacteria bacterium]|nr:signal recognition particle-docking protein FtsY [Deltaproteobacteria bacterium]